MGNETYIGWFRADSLLFLTMKSSLDATQVRMWIIRGSIFFVKKNVLSTCLKVQKESVQIAEQLSKMLWEILER